MPETCEISRKSEMGQVTNCDDLIDTIATKLKDLEYFNTSKCFYLKD